MICVPIKRKTVQSALKDLKEAEGLANLTEIWFDQLTGSLEPIFKAAKKPIVYKCTNFENLEKILNFKPAYIDLDLAAPPSIIKKVKKISPKTSIILSFHNFKETPPINDLKKILTKMRKKGAQITKLAVMAKSFQDSLGLMQLLSETSHPAIMLAMGEKGAITRTAGHLLGNYLTYAPLKTANSTAPGQIDVKSLKKIIN